MNVRERLAAWPRRRWIAMVAAAPVVAVALFRASGVEVAQVSAGWLLLLGAGSVVGAAVLASYVPVTGTKPDIGCTPCATMAALTLVGATMAFRNYGPLLVGPGLATAVMLFGLAQRVGQASACEVPQR